jgi:Arc/MetJ family transcription regulator
MEPVLRRLYHRLKGSMSMTAQPESPVSPVKIRLDDSQMETLSDALKVAGAAMRGAALVADAVGERFTADIANGRAEEFEQLLALGEGITRITVRF